MLRKHLKRAFLVSAVPLVFLSFIFLVGGCPAPGGGGKDPDNPGQNEPVLAVTPSALDFDISTDARSIEVKNIGNGTLEWWVCDEESSGFADCVPSSEEGLLPGETMTVQVRVDRPSLPKNADPPICDSIKIESNGGACVLTLSVAVDTSILLKGMVKEVGSGTGIEGVVVTAEWGTPPATDPPRCQSGVDGSYSVKVENNTLSISTLSISAEKTGYHSYTTEEGTKFLVVPDPDDPDLKYCILFDIEMTPVTPD